MTMHKRTVFRLGLSAALAILAAPAFAQPAGEPAPSQPPPGPGTADTPPPLDDADPEPPATDRAALHKAAAATAVAAEDIAAGKRVEYGMAARGRYVAVPGFILDLFTVANQPLHSWGAGAEFFRRKGDLDMVFGLSYLKMGPPDGNWLGKGKNPAVDTDLVQFRDFNFVQFDATFVWRSHFSPYVSARYGAGLGLALILGDVLRTSNWDRCTAENASDFSQCHPDPARIPGCDGSSIAACEVGLHASQGAKDEGPMNPHRHKETSVPGAIPVLNLLVGFDFRIPDVKGFEIRLEGGYSLPAFFAGLALAYVFP